MSAEMDEVKRLGAAFRMENAKLRSMGFHPELVLRGQELAMLHDAAALMTDFEVVERLRQYADGLEADLMKGLKPLGPIAQNAGG